jgi:hypothetical protein
LAEELLGAAAEEEMLHCSHRAHACPRSHHDDCLCYLVTNNEDSRTADDSVRLHLLCILNLRQGLLVSYIICLTVNQ